MGVTQGIVLNQEGWWGEGDDMLFVDGSEHAHHEWNRLGRLLQRRLGF